MAGFKWKTAEEKALSKELHGNSFVGKAFQRMCRAGCDPDFLESRLISLRMYKDRPKKYFSASDKRQLNRLVLTLRQCAKKVQRFVPLMVLAGKIDWLITPSDVPFTLALLSKQLAEAAQRPLRLGGRNPSLGERVAELVDDVKARVSRPHYKEMAELIAAVLKKPSFSEDDLKMMVRRNRRPKRIIVRRNKRQKRMMVRRKRRSKRVTQAGSHQQPGVTDKS